MKHKKVLVTANLDSFFLKFLIPNLKLLHELGYEVHVASNGNTKCEDIPYCDKKFNVCFTRNLLNKNNFVSYKQIKKIIEENDYDLIHCHTPFGGAITRLAARKKRKKGKLKVIYTAHGFHFFKGAPLKNWLLFYTAEKWLAHYTDILITINKEDYNIAKKKFKTKVKYIPGVGIDSSKFTIKMDSKDKNDLRKSLNLNDKDFVIIYVAELNKNKNQLLAINIIKELIKDDENIKLLLVGNDSYNRKYQKLVQKLGLEKNVIFAGYRKDIPQLLKISNLVISTSLREGLPVNLMEGQMSNLPIVATNCRGNRDLIINGKNGYIVQTNDVESFVKYVKLLRDNKEKYAFMKKNSQILLKDYFLDNVIKELRNIYKKIK